MDFSLTPDEAQSIARAVHADLRRRRFKVEVEVPVADLVPRPTLLAESNDLKLIVEAQKHPSLSTAVTEIVNWAHRERAYVEIFIATGLGGSISGHLLSDLARLGVGLMLVSDEGRVEMSTRPRNPALVIRPDPTLKLGRLKSEVNGTVESFNAGNRKASLAALCEIVERETDALCLKLARKGYIDKEEATVRKMDWSSQINIAASADRYRGGRVPVVSSPTKDDLQSFRGARNLIDHKARTKRDERQRERQFAERMMMGPRLAAELLALQRKVK